MNRFWLNFILGAMFPFAVMFVGSFFIGKQAWNAGDWTANEFIVILATAIALGLVIGLIERKFLKQLNKGQTR